MSRDAKEKGKCGRKKKRNGQNFGVQPQHSGEMGFTDQVSPIQNQPITNGMDGRGEIFFSFTFLSLSVHNQKVIVSTLISVARNALQWAAVPYIDDRITLSYAN